MAPIIVTGSNIPVSASEVGPSPIDYLGTDQIRSTNSPNLFDAITKLDPSFSGNASFGQAYDDNSASTGESYLFLRNLPTLILLDGNRLTTSPLSQTAGGDAGAVNINLIPTSMIDRVEVLKDGASAQYGSDAIGGVINFITKKNYNGAELSGQYGFATDNGGYYSDKESLVGGIATHDTQIFAGIEYTFNNQILAKDRPNASLDYGDFVAAGGGAPPSYSSSRAPGTVVTSFGSYLPRNSPYALGTPGYTSGAFTKTPFNYAAAQGDTQAQFDASMLAAGYVSEAASPNLATSSGIPVNTTSFGSFIVTPQEREQAFANIDRDIYEKTFHMYGTFLFTHTNAKAELAPQPSDFSSPTDQVSVPANNPYNPFGEIVGAGSPDGLNAKYRFIDVGNRPSDQTDDYYHFLGGFKGDFGLGTGSDSEYHYDASFGYDREESTLEDKNYISKSQLNLALQPNSNPVLAAEGLSNLPDPSSGSYAPIYNPFTADPNSNSSVTTNDIRVTEFNYGVSELYEAKAGISGYTPFELPAGPIGFAFGGEYRIESLSISVDGLTQEGGLVGANMTGSVSRKERETGSGYFEANIPLVSEDMKIPGIHTLSVDGSGRVDQIEDGADSEISRITASYQPYDDEITFRGNFSNSFQATSLYQLYGPPVQSFNDLSFSDGSAGQLPVDEEHTSDVPDSKAQNWGVGVVISPKFVKGLTVSADYYNVTYSSIIYQDEQGVINDLEANGASSVYSSEYQTLTGAHLTTNAPNQITATNYGILNLQPNKDPVVERTSGIDFKVNYVIPWQDWGVITVGANGTWLINYDAQDVPGGNFNQFAGTFADPNARGGGAQGLLPKWQVNPYLTYDFGGFNYTLNATYIPSVKDIGDYIPNEYEFNDYSNSGLPFRTKDYYRLDMSVGYEWGKSGPSLFGRKLFGGDPKETADPKAMRGAASLAETRVNNWYDGTRVSFGVNNVTNTKPVFLPSSVTDNTAGTSYDEIGQFVFVQVSKKF